ncbi:MAG: hypothetical protein Satyrvirus3_27 [Satyrvirus sp.]|uniref:Translation initiation factor IF2/IF5 domain-containing protein n=1 Tax=Satyrvirus sp. TaxID=2487771 RepID=A0A3G5AD15_9VIRU|nr:MAG: hypothetical protein Satyrvirus3_27 [Satyrvirus sp.]
MSVSVNIGNSNDPFYRYKRPTSIVQNKGNKTIISNLDAISKSLYTKPAYILHYIQIKKSAPITPNGEIKMFIGKNEIETLVNEFINDYILCNKCSLPELVIKKIDSKLCFSCNACGTVVFVPENKFTKIIFKEFTK